LHDLFEDKTKLTKFTYSLGMMTGVLALNFYQNEHYIKLIITLSTSYFIMQKFNDFLVPIREKRITINGDLGAEELEKSLKKVFEEMNNE
jgi:hypothetical protein